MGYQKGIIPPTWEQSTSKKLKKSIISLIKLADGLIEKDNLKGSEVSSLLRDMAGIARILEEKSTSIISVRSASDASHQLTGILSGLVAVIKRLPPAGQRKLWGELQGAFNKIDTGAGIQGASPAPGLEISPSPLCLPSPDIIDADILDDDGESITPVATTRGQHPDYGSSHGGGQLVDGVEGRGSQGRERGGSGEDTQETHTHSKGGPHQ